MQGESYVLIVWDENTRIQDAVVPKLVRFVMKNTTLICKKGSNVLLTTNTIHVTYSVVVTEVDGVKCRALINTGAGSSYVSSSLIIRLNKKPVRKESIRIETLMHLVLLLNCNI